ncbi:MAG: DUF4363 family protein [Clostridia bacterium]|nr:DUF4363 family protein [Clostridia bacterium]
MKDLIIVIVVIALVFVPGYYTKKYLEDSGKKIVETLVQIREDVEEGRFENSNLVYELKDEWDEEQELWNVFSNHQNTDQIQREIEKLITNYEEKERHEALINITEIKSIIEDAPKGEGIALVNIF